MKRKHWLTIAKLVTWFSTCALPVPSSWNIPLEAPTHQSSGLSHFGLQLWGLRSGSWARRTRILGSQSTVFESKGFSVIQSHALLRKKKRGWRNEFPASADYIRHGFSLFRHSDKVEKTIAKLQRNIATVSTTGRASFAFSLARPQFHITTYSVVYCAFTLMTMNPFFPISLIHVFFSIHHIPSSASFIWF